MQSDKTDWHIFLQLNSLLIKLISAMRLSIGFSFIYILSYIISILFHVSDVFIYWFVLGWPLIMIWVVVSILKDKHQPKKTFSKYFYQDEEIMRS